MRPYRPEPPEATSRRMSAVRRHDTGAEILLRRELWRMGVRYRLHRASLPGKPDIVVTRSKAAIFVDGDFWHGRLLQEKGVESLQASFRGARREYWVARITKNVERDTRVNVELQKAGWRVIRVWERDVTHNPKAVARSIMKRLSAIL